MLCSPADLPAKGFSNQIPLVARGNCTFYEKVRLAQGGGARGLLIVSKETLVRPPGRPSGQPGTRVTAACRAAGPTRARARGREEPAGTALAGSGVATAGGCPFDQLTLAGDSDLWTLASEGACPRAVLGFGAHVLAPPPGPSGQIGP